MITKDISQGMSLSEIIASGEDPSLYQSLTSNTISTTSNSLDNLTSLISQLSEIVGSDPASENQKVNLIEQIITICSQESASIDSQVDADLTAQETLKSASTVSDTIATAIPNGNQSSRLFSMIATDKLQQLASVITKIHEE